MQESENQVGESCPTCEEKANLEESRIDKPADIWTSSRALKNWIGGAFLTSGLILAYFVPGFDTLLLSAGGGYFVSDALFILSIAVGGNVILKNGYEALRDKNLGISLLMSFAILGSVLASILGGKHIFMEGATLSFLFNFAELMEDYSIRKTRGSLKELMDLSPDIATVRRDGDEIEVPIGEVTVDETVVVRPGDKIPVDAKVIKGSSSVNEAPITGESLPVDKMVGDEVYAGTINEHGYMELEATSESSESTVSKIIGMVKNAERIKTKHEKFIEKFSSYYTPIVVVLAVILAFLPPVFLGKQWTYWFLRGITMLVLACPCAFVISTPVSVVSGITSAAKNGVLIRNGVSLEAMGEVGAVAFDKTGTLTTGELTITDIIPFNGRDEEDVIRCARGVEERSEHPIASAIVDHVEEKGGFAPDRKVEEFEEISGKGVKATLEGKLHYAGKPSLMEELGFNLKHVHHSSDSERVRMEATDKCSVENCLDLVENTIPRLQNEGKTVILVAAENELEGIIAVADEIRPSAKEAIKNLKSSGIKPIMLTGDNENTAGVIANELGIEDYYAELMPDEKVDVLKRLSEEYGAIAMVGDGINDAPALAVSDVGIAMGAAGSGTAIETADIALMQDDLTKFSYLLELSDKTRRIIRENIFFSLGIKAVLAAGVPFGFVTIALAVVAGDAGMTVGVTGNAMRLSRIKIE